MEKESELDQVEEIEEVSEEVQGNVLIEAKQKKTALSSYSKLDKEEESLWSDEEADHKIEKKESKLNLERVMEALETVQNGLRAPSESAENSIIEEIIKFEEIEEESFESEEDTESFHISLEPILENQSEINSPDIDTQSIKSPTKKEEEAVFKDLLNEIDYLYREYLRELMKMNKLKLDVNELENRKNQISELRKFNAGQIEDIKKELLNQNAKNLDRLDELSKKNQFANLQVALMHQHLAVCSRYFDGKLNNYRAVEENLAMAGEDLYVQLLEASNKCKVAKSQQKKIKKIVSLNSQLEEKREKNDFLIQKYSAVLKKVSKSLENRENLDFSKKVSEINKAITDLQESIHDFTYEALEDPRKMIPYIRSASPARVQSIQNIT